MTKSASGTIEEPGKNVKAKSGLNKAICDQGWGELLTFLDYKLKYNGGKLISVDPKYTSQTCTCCGNFCKENRKTRDNFECIQCGHKDNADVVGAINILRRGQRRIACGDTSLFGESAQEPTSEVLSKCA